MQTTLNSLRFKNTQILKIKSQKYSNSLYREECRSHCGKPQFSAGKMELMKNGRFIGIRIIASIDYVNNKENL